MRIEQSDIDCLIEVSVFLKGLIEAPGVVQFSPNMRDWQSRLRKVYILLLQASDKGQTGIEKLVNKGIPDDSPAAKAIRALCPSAVPEKKCVQCLTGQN